MNCCSPMSRALLQILRQVSAGCFLSPNFRLNYIFLSTCIYFQLIQMKRLRLRQHAAAERKIRCAQRTFSESFFVPLLWALSVERRWHPHLLLATNHVINGRDSSCVPRKWRKWRRCLLLVRCNNMTWCNFIVRLHGNFFCNLGQIRSRSSQTN